MSPVFEEPPRLLLLPQATVLLFTLLYSKMSLNSCLRSQYLYFLSSILTLKPTLIRISSPYSTKTALIKVTSDLAAKSSGHFSVLMLFYM